MALLSYDIRVVGLQAVNRALRSVERRVAALNRRQSRGLGGTGAAGRRGGGSMAAEVAANRRLSDRLVVEEARTQSRLRQIRARGTQRRISDARRAARAEERIAKRSAMTMEQYKRRVHGSGALRGRTMGRTGQSLRGGVRAVGAMGAGLLAIGGGYAIGSAIGQEKRLQASAAALANQARGTEGGAWMTFGALQKRALDVARVQGIKSGQGPEAVIGGMRQFQAITGRFDIATAYADYMTEIADATDAGLGDVGRTAGQIFQAINATGKDAGESIDATMKIMDAMAGQSKIGSIEMNDLAKEMGKLMSATANFKGDIGELAADMGAMAQTAIAGGASSAPEAMTALMRFADDLVQKGAASPIYKKLGIDVFEREMIGGKEVRAKLKSPVEVIKEIVGATKGDIAKISGMFGIRAKKAVDPFARIYREAEAKQAGTGIQAIEQRFEQFRAVSLKAPERKEAAQARRRQADRQFDRAMQKFNDAIGQELLPVLTQLIPKFVELIPALTDALSGLVGFASWFDENIGIGVAIAAVLTKDIAAAGIGAAMRNAMGLGGGMGGGGAGGPGGAYGGLALTAAILGLTAAMEQARKLADEAGEFKSEEDLEREIAVGGRDVGEKVIRERGFKQKAREALGGLGWESTAADIAADWGTSREELWKERDSKGKERVRRRAIRDEEKLDEPAAAVPMSGRWATTADRPAWQTGASFAGVGGMLEATTTGTGERQSEAAVKAAMTLDQFRASAAKAKAALDEVAATKPNRGTSPSPTAQR
jgi:hypothetical protein